MSSSDVEEVDSDVSLPAINGESHAAPAVAAAPKKVENRGAHLRKENRAAHLQKKADAAKNGTASAD